MFMKDLELCYSSANPNLFKLAEDPEFMLTFNVLFFAKSHNYFGGMNKYMKTFVRIRNR